MSSAEHRPTGSCAVIALRNPVDLFLVSINLGFVRIFQLMSFTKLQSNVNYCCYRVSLLYDCVYPCLKDT